MGDWYFDDLEVGHTVTTMGRTVTEADLVNFVGLSGVFEELFINAEKARTESLFEGRVVPAMLIVIVAEGLYVLTGHTHHGRAFLGLDELRLSHPVLCGDTIRVEVSVETARLVERPGHGLVKLRHRVVNHRDVEILTYTTTRMLERRPDAA